MGVAHSSSLAHCPYQSIFLVNSRASVPKSNPNSNIICLPYLRRPNNHFPFQHHPTINSSISAANIAPLKCGEVMEMESEKPTIDLHAIDENLVQKMVYDALVWSSLHGLVVGDRSVQRSGTVPGVGLVHAPFALLPLAFPEFVIEMKRS